MKALKIILLLLVVTGNVLAQFPGADRCPYKGPQMLATRDSYTVGDFTIRTTDGISRNLYSTLDSGKTVFVDLFFTTCSWCQYYAPVIEEVYQNHGAGAGDIEFWGISNNLFDPDSVIDQYRLDYNITNPCAGPQGGGTTAHTTVISGQNFQGWPTYCVICPDRSMFFDPCYPPTVNGFDPYFEVCAAMVDVEDTPLPSESHISLYPNPARNQLNIAFASLPDEDKLTIEIYNTMGSLSSVIEKNKDEEIILDISLLKPGTYFLHLIRGTGPFASGKFSVIR
jgi:thiol-disulfide isomerase/thioredoxin